MAADIETGGQSGAALTQYWGGLERGICLQLTGPSETGRQYIQLDLGQVRALARDLELWVSARAGGGGMGGGTCV